MLQFKFRKYYASTLHTQYNENKNKNYIHKNTQNEYSMRSHYKIKNLTYYNGSFH